MFRIIGTLVTVGLALVFAVQVLTAQNRLGLDVYAGSAFPTDEEPNSDAMYGVGANFKYFTDDEDHLAVGAGLGYYAKSYDGTFIGVDYDLTSYVLPVYGLVEYHFGEPATMVRPYVGADVGVYTFGVSGTLGEADFEPDAESFFGVAPKAGVKLNVGEQVGIFGEVDYNAVFGKEDPSGDASPTNADFENVSTEFFSVNVGAGFRF